jgi:hypothetical protein
VYRGARHISQWPLVGQSDDAEYEIYGLKDGDWLDGAVEVLGEPVEEELGPEEAF